MIISRTSRDSARAMLTICLPAAGRDRTVADGEISGWPSLRSSASAASRSACRRSNPSRLGSCPRLMFWATVRSSTRSSPGRSWRSRGAWPTWVWAVGPARPATRSFPIGMVGSREDLDQRRLPCAVLAQQAVRLARDDIEVHPVQRAHPGEQLHDAGHGQQPLRSPVRKGTISVHVRRCAHGVPFVSPRNISTSESTLQGERASFCHFLAESRYETAQSDLRCELPHDRLRRIGLAHGPVRRPGRGRAGAVTTSGRADPLAQVLELIRSTQATTRSEIALYSPAWDAPTQHSGCRPSWRPAWSRRDHPGSPPEAGPHGPCTSVPALAHCSWPSWGQRRSTQRSPTSRAGSSSRSTRTWTSPMVRTSCLQRWSATSVRSPGGTASPGSGASDSASPAPAAGVQPRHANLTPDQSGWDCFPVRQRLSSRFRAPTWVDNDVNVLALGELRRGLAMGVDDAIFVKVGTGIGAGLISDGHLHRGAQGAAGDIGHVSVGEQATRSADAASWGAWRRSPGARRSDAGALPRRTMDRAPSSPASSPSTAQSPPGMLHW